MERNFEDKAEELRAKREDQEAVYPSDSDAEEEGVVIAPGYGRRRRSVYKKDEEDQETVLKNLRSVTDQLRGITKNLSEFSTTLERTHKGILRLFDAIDDAGDTITERSKKIDKDFKRGSDAFKKRLDRFNRSLSVLDDQFVALEDIIEDLVKSKRKEVKTIERVEKLRRWYLEELSLKDLVEVQRKVADTLAMGAEEYRIVAKAVQSEMLDRVVRPLKHLRLDREIKSVGFSLLGPIGTIVHEFVEEAGGLRSAFNTIKESTLAGAGYLFSTLKGIFGKKDVEDVEKRRRVEQRLDWQMIRERRRRPARTREEVQEIDARGDTRGERPRRPKVPESFVPTDLVKEVRRLSVPQPERLGGQFTAGGILGKRDLRPAEMYLTQERGAVFETDKLYLNAKEVTGEGGKGFFDFLMDYLGLRTAMGGLARIGGILARYGRVLGWIGLGAGALYTGYKATREKGIGYGIAKGGGFLAGGVAGMYIGSAIAPGIGTVIGTVLGSFLGEKVGEWIYDALEDVDFSGFKKEFTTFVDALSYFVNEIKKFFGDIGKSVSKGIDYVSDTASSVVKWIGEKLGIISMATESGKTQLEQASKVIGRTPGDIGGASYGAFQFAVGTGTMKEFLDWMAKSPKYRRFADELRRYQPGTKEFDKLWKDIATKNKEFAEAQYEFIYQTHYAPVASQLKSLGLRQLDQSRALQEMVFARAVQQRGQAVAVFKRAFAGMTPEQISQLSPEEVIRRYYGELIRNIDLYFSKASPQVRLALVNQFRDQVKKLIAIAEQEKKQKVVGGGQVEKEVARVEQTKSIDRELRLMEAGVLADRTERDENKKEVTPVAVTGDFTSSAFDRIPSTVDDIGILLLQLGMI